MRALGVSRPPPDALPGILAPNGWLAAMVCAYVLGPRTGYDREPFAPFNLGLAMAVTQIAAEWLARRRLCLAALGAGVWRAWRGRHRGARKAASRVLRTPRWIRPGRAT